VNGRNELEDFKSHQGRGEIQDIWRYWKTWKQDGSGTIDAQLQEKAFKQTHYIPEDIRKSDPAPNQVFLPPVNHFIRLLTTISQTFLEQNHGTHIRLYRGVSYRAEDLLSRIESNPTLQNYSVYNPSVLINHTTCPEIASDFAAYNLVWEKSYSYKDIMLAPDGLRKVFDWKDGRRILMADGEFQVRGDTVRSIPGNQLYLYGDDGQSRVSLHKVAQNPSVLSDDEHSAVMGFVAGLNQYFERNRTNYPSGGPELTDDLQSVMESWFNCLKSTDVKKALNVKPTFEKIFR
jgi:hypothetical protein